MKTRLTELVGIDFPIIQAPMAGVATPALAAAVSNAGALGSIGVGAAGADGAFGMMRELAALTKKPWHVNFFAHLKPTRDRQCEMAWVERFSPVFSELGATPPSSLNEGYRSFLDDKAQLDAVLTALPRVASFHFGLPDADQIAAMHDKNILLFGSATSVEEALLCEAAGMDAVIAQGVEAGGHRGVHNGRTDQQLGLFALLPQIVDAVRVPVIAAGGVADGRGIAAALALGADGVQMGTAFIACPESSAGERHRAMLGHFETCETLLTRGLSGRPARGLRNRLMDIAEEHQNFAPDYPIPYELSKFLSRAAGMDGFDIMLAGQAAALSRAAPAAELVRLFADETSTVMQELSTTSNVNKGMSQ